MYIKKVKDLTKKEKIMDKTTCTSYEHWEKTVKDSVKRELEREHILNVTMIQQLKHLQNEIDNITLDNIKNNFKPKTIKNQFNIISDRIKDIRNGKKPY